MARFFSLFIIPDFPPCVSSMKLDMLAKAGADILMPVMVGDAVGTAVDFAHYSFNQVKTATKAKPLNHILL